MNDLLPVDPTEQQIARANAIIVKMNEWIDQVPEAGGDGILGILEQIVAADTPEKLDAAWNSVGFGQLLGYAVRVTGIRKLKSDFKGSIPFFLLADVIVRSTGEARTATTGSYAIMAQLLNANANGMLPLDFVPHEAEEPTENGFYPQHLKVWNPAMPTEPQPSQPRRAAGVRQDGTTLADTTARIRAERLQAAKPAQTVPVTDDTPGF